MSLIDTGAPVALPEAPGRWLNIVAAARALGVTERTVRRRMAARTVQTRRERGRVLVWVSDDDRAGTPDTATDVSETRPAPSADDGDTRPDADSDASVAAVAELAALLRDALGGKSAAEQAAAMWQERARNLEAQVEQFLALPAHEEPERRGPWWRFWRRGALDNHSATSRAVSGILARF